MIEIILFLFHNNLMINDFSSHFFSLQDMDGYVSQQDYRLAKRFDFDGNGVLDADERQVGRRVLAEVCIHQKTTVLACKNTFFIFLWSTFI